MSREDDTFRLPADMDPDEGAREPGADIFDDPDQDGGGSITSVEPDRQARRGFSLGNLQLGHLLGGLFLAGFIGFMFYTKVMAPRQAQQPSESVVAFEDTSPSQDGAQYVARTAPSMEPGVTVTPPSFNDGNAGQARTPQAFAAAMSGSEVQVPPVTSNEMGSSGSLPADHSAELVAQFGALVARLEAIEESIEQLGERVTSVEATARRATPTQSNRSVPPSARPQRSVASQVLSDYKVRVARTGQAWIDHAGSTVVVHVGDTLPNGARVRSIDPNTGRVLTTKGVVVP